MLRTFFLLILSLALLQPGLSVVLTIGVLTYLLISRPQTTIATNEYDQQLLWAGLAYLLYFFINTLIQSQSVALSWHWLLENLPVALVLLTAYLMKRRDIGLSSQEVAFTAATSIHILMMLIVVFKIAAIYVTTEPWLGWIRMMGVSPGERAEFAARNPLMLASISLGFAFLSGFTLWRETAFKRQFFYGTAFIEALIIAFYFAESRSSMVTFALVGLAFLFIYKVKLQRLVKPLLLLGVVIAVAYTSIPEVKFKFERTLTRLEAIPQSLTSNGSPEDRSIELRFLMYKYSTEAIKESPIFGHGNHMRFSAIEPYMDPNDRFKYTHVHNTYLDHLVAGGIIGLALFLVHVFSPLLSQRNSTQYLEKEQRFMAWLGPLLIVGIGMTNDTHWHYVQSQFFSLLIALNILLYTNSPKSKRLSD